MTRRPSCYLTVASLASFFAPLASAQASETLAPATPTAALAPAVTANIAPAAAAQSPSASPPWVATTQVAAALNSADIAPRIRRAATPAHEALLTEIAATIDTTHSAMLEIRRYAGRLHRDGREQFTAAYDEVRLQELAVRSSLRAVRAASSGTTLSAQEKLAADYEAYARAIARAEVIADGSAPVSGLATR